MKGLLLAICLLLGIVCSHEGIAGGAQELSTADFEAMKGTKHMLVMFYAPWCGHCKNLLPVWDQVALSLKDAKDVVQVVKVDSTVEKELASSFDVRGYPTLIYFNEKGEQVSKYEGDRSEEGICAFIEEKTGAKCQRVIVPSAVVQLTPENFDSIVFGDKHVLVSFTAPWCGHCKSLKPTWEKLATAYRADNSIVVANLNADDHRELASKYGVSGFPTLKYFAPGSEEPEDYKGGRSLPDFLAFLNGKARTQRKEDGTLDQSAGRLPEFDELAKEYVAAGESRRSELLAKAKELAGAVEDAAEKVYLRAMESISKSADYVAKEGARLKNMLKDAKLTPQKIDEFQRRLNILGAFESKADEE